MSSLGDAVGADNVLAADAAASFAVDGRVPPRAVTPESVDGVSRCLRVAQAAGWGVIPVGGGLRLGVGRPPRAYDLALSTRRLQRLVAHEAADMTVTIEAGHTLAALNDALAAAGQWLPLDPPHPERTTVGGLIAADAAGPLRLSQGRVRDLLIGIAVVLADGTPVRGGGRVVKNVAGYDLMKLFTGSLGTLGVITEATFKVRPLPERQIVCILPAADTAAGCAVAQQALQAAVAPLYVEALNAAAAARAGIEAPAAVVVGCGGTQAEIDVQRQRLAALGGTSLSVREYDAAAALYAAVRDLSAAALPVAADAAIGAKLSLLPSHLARVVPHIEVEANAHGLRAMIQVHAGTGVVRLHARGEALGEIARFAAWLRGSARAAGGWVTFEALPVAMKEHVDPWDDDVPGLALMRGLKATLDPQGRLSPGRFVGGI